MEDEYDIKLLKEEEKTAQICSLFCSLRITHTHLYPSFIHTSLGIVLHDSHEHEQRIPLLLLSFLATLSRSQCHHH
jgi:hypothetical protein